MRRLSLLLMPALLLSALACSKPLPERAFRSKAYQRIVTLGPGVSEILVGNTDAGPRVKGRTAADNWPTYGLNSIPIVASVKPDAEAIAKVNPDLIVYDSALFSPADIEKLKDTAKDATMYAVSANTIDDFENQIFEIGSLVGSEIRVNDYVIKIDQARSKAQASESSQLPKVAVILPGDGGGDFIAGTGSFVADAVKAAGGQPVGPDATLFVPANGEAIAAFNPDIIIVPAKKTDMKGALSVLNNPAYKSTNAVKLGNIKAVDQDVLLRRGGRVDVLIDALDTIVGDAKRS